MKWWMPGGLSVLLGIGATGTWAEELPWRPAGSAPKPPNLVRAKYETPGAPETPEFRPISLTRPTPLVRGQKADIEVSRPLPAGPILLFAQDKKEPPVSISDPKKTEANPPLEIIPVTPRALNSPPPTMLDGKCDCTGGGNYFMGGPAYLGGASNLMGDNCDPCGNGCDPCCPTACVMDCCDCCMPRPAFWLRAEYLMWSIKGDNYPALVTQGNINQPPGSVAVLGRDGTTVLLDGSDFNNSFRSGGRVSAGFWLPRYDCIGFDASYFYLNRRSQNFEFGPPSDPNVVIARPFTEMNPGVPNPGGAPGFRIPPSPRSQFVTNTAANISGTLGVDTYSQMWGVDANLRYKLWCNGCSWVDLTLGLKHFELREGITFREDLATIAENQGVPAGTPIRVRDRFDTRNYFDGGQIGLDGEYRFLPRWSVSGFAKVGLGTVRQSVNINGTTFNGLTGESGTGGLYALSTNIGVYNRNRFAVMPEVGLRVNYDLTDHLRLYVGYNLTYLSSVVRPGDQIDTKVNTGFLPFITSGQAAIGQGPRNPAVLFKTSDFWAQGVNFGVEYHW